jgi:hypothetical protein
MANATKQPDFSSLLVSLANSGASLKSHALYQTVYLLLQKMMQSQGLFQKDLEGANGEGGLKNVTYITQDDETALFVSSHLNCQHE